MAFIKQAELTEMIPICEYAPGVVLACVSYHGKKHYILSKDVYKRQVCTVSSVRLP